MTRDSKDDGRGKVYISGTGRAGTTFLIQLLTELGLDTGYPGDADDIRSGYFEKARAGFEWNLDDVTGPRFQKSPYLCDRLEDLLKLGVRIEHIVVPVRKISDSAKSRIKVQIETSGAADGEPVAGGLWSTTSAAEQESVLRSKLTRLIEVSVEHDLPLILLSFPRLVLDCDYLFGKMQPVLGEISQADFRKAFDKVARPDLVSRFDDQAVAPAGA